MKKIIATIIKCILFFLIWAVLIAVLIPLDPFEKKAMWRLWSEAMPFAVVVVLTVIFWLLLEKRQIKLSIFSHPIKGVLTGAATGVVWIGLSFGILFLLGTLQIKGTNEMSNLHIWILAVFLNAAMQELLMRGYLYQLIKQKFHTIVAVILTTALFTVLHGSVFEAGIIPIINIVTMSLLMTMLLEYTGSLLAPILAHFIWNCAGSLILNVVLLTDDYPHLLDVKFSGKELFSGGAYMIEGSVIVTALNVILIILLFILKLRQPKTPKAEGDDEEE